MRSLLHKEQASLPMGAAPSAKPPLARPLSVEESKHVAELLHKWVKAKGYRLPHRTMIEAAENIGTTSVMLHRYSVNCLGQDFRAWRTALRIDDAKKILLEEPGLSSARVAAMVGIQDRSNFLRIFTESTGQTPDQWRKSHGVKG